MRDVEERKLIYFIAGCYLQNCLNRYRELGSCNDVLCKAKGMYDVLCVTCFDVISLRSGTVLDKQIQEHQLLVALKM